MEVPDYLQSNLDAWNQRTAHHLGSAFYDVEGFLAGNNSLREPELALLGNVEGQRLLHLQCHFGQDSLSLARMGANVVGVDFSDEAISAARKLNEALGLSVEFIQCDLYALPAHLDQTFDIVFTSYGTIGWLPDIEKWAHIVNRYLRPGGRFVMVEFHPLLWMMDNDFAEIIYSYFRSEPIIEVEQGTYADREATFTSRTVTWNHGLAEVIQALLSQGLSLEQVQEYDFSSYNCFSHTEKIGEQKWRIKHHGDRLPMMYSLVMRKLDG